jgi:AcrR family transcriptional regulator
MTVQQSDARQRVIETAAEMLARFGLNATSIREMAKRANAPLGSTYHHFPDGKQQVLAEAVELAGQKITASLEHYLAHGVITGISEFFSMWRNMLLQTDFHIGCPVLAVAVEEPLEGMSSDTQKAAADAFSQWEKTLATALTAQGRDPVDAANLAILIIAATEGAIALSRASRDIAPWDRITGQVIEIILR